MGTTMIVYLDLLETVLDLYTRYYVTLYKERAHTYTHTHSLAKCASGANAIERTHEAVQRTLYVHAQVYAVYIFNRLDIQYIATCIYSDIAEEYYEYLSNNITNYE